MSWFNHLRSRYLVDVEPQRSERRLELVFVALLLIVLLQISWWLLGGLRTATVTSLAPARDSLRVVDASVTGAITAPESLELQARPLFWASRRPNNKGYLVQPGAAQGDEASARGLKDLQVTGALGAGDQGQAIVMYKDKLMRLGIGDSVAGWTLQSVSLGQVVFVSAGGRDVRRLMPLPVVEGQQSPSAQAQTPGGATVTGKQTANTNAQLNAASKAQKKNNKAEATLSLGGLR